MLPADNAPAGTSAARRTTDASTTSARADAIAAAPAVASSTRLRDALFAPRRRSLSPASSSVLRTLALPVASPASPLAALLPVAAAHGDPTIPTGGDRLSLSPARPNTTSYLSATTAASKLDVHLPAAPSPTPLDNFILNQNTSELVPNGDARSGADETLSATQPSSQLEAQSKPTDSPAAVELFPSAPTFEPDLAAVSLALSEPSVAVALQPPSPERYSPRANHAERLALAFEFLSAISFGLPHGDEDEGTDDDNGRDGDEDDGGRRENGAKSRTKAKRLRANKDDDDDGDADAEHEDDDDDGRRVNFAVANEAEDGGDARMHDESDAAAMDARAADADGASHRANAALALDRPLSSEAADADIWVDELFSHLAALRGPDFQHHGSGSATPGAPPDGNDESSAVANAAAASSVSSAALSIRTRVAQQFLNTLSLDGPLGRRQAGALKRTIRRKLSGGGTAAGTVARGDGCSINCRHGGTHPFSQNKLRRVAVVSCRFQENVIILFAQFSLIYRSCRLSSHPTHRWHIDQRSPPPPNVAPSGARAPSSSSSSSKSSTTARQ